MLAPSEILHAKPEDFHDKQTRGKLTATVFGGTLNGVFHACLLADAGYKINFTDPDQTTTTQLAKGKVPFLPQDTEAKLKNHIKTKRIMIASDVKAAVLQSDIVILSVPVEIDSKRKPEYSKIEKSIRIIANNLRKGSLVIMTSVVGLGTMETLFRQPIEDASGYKAGIDFGLVYSPISTEHRPTLESMRNRGRIVASKDKKSLEVASAFLASIHNKELRSSNDTRTAEIAAVFDSAALNVNSALANGFAIFCEKARVEYSKVCELLNTDSLDSLFPATQAGDIEDYAPNILLQDAENLSVKQSLVSQAEQAHAEIVKHVTNLTKDALRSCEKSVRRARIALLGISSLRNEKSSPRTIVKALVKTLEARGAKVRLYDPFLSEWELREAQIRSARNLSEALEGADCFIVVTAHDTFKRLNLKKIKVLMRFPAAIVDFEGCFEPEKVENEGFVYRGVGSGVWSK